MRREHTLLLNVLLRHNKMLYLAFPSMFSYSTLSQLLWWFPKEWKFMRILKRNFKNSPINLKKHFHNFAKLLFFHIELWVSLTYHHWGFCVLIYFSFQHFLFLFNSRFFHLCCRGIWFINSFLNDFNEF